MSAGPVVSKLNVHLKSYWFPLKMSIVGLQKSNWSGWCMLGGSLTDVSTFMIKIFQIQRWQFVPLSKFFQCENFLILVTLKTRSSTNLWHAIKGVAIGHLGYKHNVCTSNGYWFVGICLSYCFNEKTELWPIKSRNEDAVT